MVNISAAQVKTLRTRTDAPMMECKKALVEAEGDLEKAEELLRVRLGNKASKAASRIAAEGLIGQFIDEAGRVAAMIEINCETDFVARNEDFIAFVNALARKVAEDDPQDVAALSALPFANGQSVDQYRLDLVGKIGENITIRRFVRYAAAGNIAAYVHTGSKIGVLVDAVEVDHALAKDVAMHIAAMKPDFLAPEDVSATVIDQERNIARQKAEESGKPPELIEKLVTGMVNKFIKQVTLLGQPFVKDNQASVANVLQKAGGRVAAFTLYVVGQGLEKRSDDFAAEVAAQISAAK